MSGGDKYHQLRVAFIGKGGAGKSSITGTVCRQLARRGHPVLALDIDTVPGLAYSIGIPSDAHSRLPSGLAEMSETTRGRHWKTKKGAGPAHLVDQYATRGADGVRFLELGKLPVRVEPSVSVTFRHVMHGFRRPGWAVIADLAAGTRQPMFGWARFAPIRVIVVEPSAKSVMTARRLERVATHVLVNKVQTPHDIEMVTAALSLPLLATIPYDEDLVEADRQGMAPIDFAPHSIAVEAAGQVAERLEQLQ